MVENKVSNPHLPEALRMFRGLLFDGTIPWGREGAPPPPTINFVDIPTPIDADYEIYDWCHVSFIIAPENTQDYVSCFVHPAMLSLVELIRNEAKGRTIEMYPIYGYENCIKDGLCLSYHTEVCEESGHPRHCYSAMLKGLRQ